MNRSETSCCLGIISLILLCKTRLLANKARKSGMFALALVLERRKVGMTGQAWRCLWHMSRSRPILLQVLVLEGYSAFQMVVIA